MGEMRFVIAAMLLLAGILLALYGLFAIAYNGDGGSDAYVKIAGQDVNAYLVGVLALFVGTAAILGFVGLKRRSGRSANRRSGRAPR
jgi:hypothetical protein